MQKEDSATVKVLLFLLDFVRLILFRKTKVV